MTSAMRIDGRLIMDDKKKDLPFGPTNIQKYDYKCSSCGYHDEIEDIVVDAYFFSQGCKRGEYPKLTCPNCHKTMKYAVS
jgi:C4-type Zn-finger protein